MQIGDRIKDIEDTDYYYLGAVVSLIPLKYEIEYLCLNGEIVTDRKGEITEPQLWYIEKID